MRKTVFRLLGLATLLAVASFGLTNCGDDDAESLCQDYADKLVECGAAAGGMADELRNTCVTLLSIPGSDDSDFRCVVNNSCDDLASACGI